MRGARVQIIQKTTTHAASGKMRTTAAASASAAARAPSACALRTQSVLAPQPISITSPTRMRPRPPIAAPSRAGPAGRKKEATTAQNDSPSEPHARGSKQPRPGKQPDAPCGCTQHTTERRVAARSVARKSATTEPCGGARVYHGRPAAKAARARTKAASGMANEAKKPKRAGTRPPRP